VREAGQCWTIGDDLITVIVYHWLLACWLIRFANSWHRPCSRVWVGCYHLVI
jgi:hypothetical protein